MTEHTNHEKSASMKNQIRTVLKVICLGVMAVCLIRIGLAYHQSAQHRAQQNRLKEMTAASDEEAPSPDVGTGDELPPAAASDQNLLKKEEGGDDPTESKPEMLQQYAALYEENRELAGWLAIEGMRIDYPVMQSEDDEYYLRHDFYGADSKYGCLYVREQADLDRGTNFIIYGHNMKDGAMFGDLDLYLKESFYEEHPSISFDTLYEERTYDIIAVFRSQIYSGEEDVFRYYQFYEADTQEEFDEFYGNIKELSLYDTGVEAQFGDTFLTLSTCAYHVPDGRLVVVAKRRE